jgi:hypothetical protein
VYFGAYNFTASSLIELDDDEDRPFLYLFQDPGAGNRKLNAKTLASALSKVRSTLKLGSVITVPEGDRGGTYLAKQPLGNVVTIEKLNDLQAVCEEFLIRAEAFTNALAPVVYRVANII